MGGDDAPSSVGGFCNIRRNFAAVKNASSMQRYPVSKKRGWLFNALIVTSMQHTAPGYWHIAV